MVHSEMEAMMKPYGTVRDDHRTCADGCCLTGRVRGADHADYVPNERVRRVSKRRARQALRKEIELELDAA